MTHDRELIHERKRLRRVLRKHTHFKNTHEFFVAVLFEGGAPPHPIARHFVFRENTGLFQQLGSVNRDWGEYKEMRGWRERLGIIMSERLHHSIDPSFAVQEYLKWLFHQQERNRISVVCCI